MSSATKKASGNSLFSIPTFKNSSTPIIGILYLTNLPDPQHRYEGLRNSYNLSGVTIHTADVRDHNGKIIPPTDYAAKISNDDIVEVEVLPKLYVPPITLYDSNIEYVFKLDHPPKGECPSK